MKEIVLIIRPEKLEVLKSILDQMKCGGMTISTVMGCGAQKGAVEGVNEIKGFKTNINLLPKVRVEVVVDDSKVENIVAEDPYPYRRAWRQGFIDPVMTEAGDGLMAKEHDKEVM